MTIENIDAFLASLWDWACLDGCFGNTRIRPTDIDGLVERNGQFLYFETKLPGAAIPTGQEITFSSLLKHDHNCIIIVWGQPGEPETIELRYKQMVRVYENSSIGRLRQITNRWYEWAENQTPMPRFY